MPSDNPLLRPRAVALGMAAALAMSVAPGAVAGADPPPRAQAITALSRFVSSRSSAVAAPAARDTHRVVDPPAAMERDVIWDGVAGQGQRDEPQPTTRQQIAARCPDPADANLLRNGADADGRGLCVRSVEQARTDVAAAAIVEGFELLGIPYSRSRRGQEGYDDCSSFVGRAFREAGNPLSDSDWEPSSSVMRNAAWADIVEDPLPGDILWRSGHVAMALADGYQMHTGTPGDVSHVRSMGRYRKVLAVDADG